MKKLLVLFAVLAMLFMTVPAIAGHHHHGCQNCTQVSVDVDAGASLANSLLGSFKNSSIAGGYSLASVDAEAIAEATAKDYYTYEWQWVPGHWTQDGEAGWYKKQHGNGHWEYKFFKNGHPQPQGNNEWIFVRGIYIPGHWNLAKVFHHGEGEAHAFMKIFQKTPKVCIITTGLKETGLSFTIVHTKAELYALGRAWAEGSPNCPQTAIIDLSGELAALAYGNSGVFHPNGQSFAAAHAEGTTTAEFAGYKSDISNGYAGVTLFGKVSAEQNVFASSFVSEDGTVASNFAMVQGGSAHAVGDIELTGINSSGMVTQVGQATNGLGAFAYGSSTAQFSGAIGQTYQSCFGSYGNGAGLAVVSGYNSVQTTAAGVTVTSSQHGYATTGGDHK